MHIGNDFAILPLGKRLLQQLILLSDNKLRQTKIIKQVTENIPYPHQNSKPSNDNCCHKDFIICNSLCYKFMYNILRES